MLIYQYKPEFTGRHASGKEEQDFEQTYVFSGGKQWGAGVEGRPRRRRGIFSSECRAPNCRPRRAQQGAPRAAPPAHLPSPPPPARRPPGAPCAARGRGGRCRSGGPPGGRARGAGGGGRRARGGALARLAARLQAPQAAVVSPRLRLPRGPLICRRPPGVPRAAPAGVRARARAPACCRQPVLLPGRPPGHAPPLLPRFLTRHPCRAHSGRPAPTPPPSVQHSARRAAPLPSAALPILPQRAPSVRPIAGAAAPPHCRAGRRAGPPNAVRGALLSRARPRPLATARPLLYPSRRGADSSRPPPSRLPPPHRTRAPLWPRARRAACGRPPGSLASGKPLSPSSVRGPRLRSRPGTWPLNTPSQAAAALPQTPLPAPL
jgi:hypothetical protein